MFTTNTPKLFWGDVVLIACYLINKMPTNVLHFQTSINVFSKNFPKTLTIIGFPLKIFGSIAFVHNHELNHNKLDPKAFKCIFLGYGANQKGYKRYFLEKRIICHNGCYIFENTPFYPKNSLQVENESEGNFWKCSSDILHPTLLVSSSLTPPNYSSLNVPAIDHNLNLENGNNYERNSENRVPNLDVQQEP